MVEKQGWAHIQRSTTSTLAAYTYFLNTTIAYVILSTASLYLGKYNWVHTTYKNSNSK